MDSIIDQLKRLQRTGKSLEESNRLNAVRDDLFIRMGHALGKLLNSKSIDSVEVQTLVDEFNTFLLNVDAYFKNEARKIQ